MSSRGRSQLRAAGRTHSSFKQGSPPRRPVRRRIGVAAAIAGIVAASFTFVVAPARALAAGNAVVPNSAFTSFTDVAMQGTDDGSWPTDTGAQVFPFGFHINYFGVQEPGAYINNNGNLTFTGPLSGYTPFGMAGTTTPIIAPYFADVETIAGNRVNIGTGMLDGFHAFVANWPGVECYSNGNAAITDNFQVILIDRPDLGTSANGDNFQIEFNYNSLLWDAGQYTGGDANCTHASNANSAAAGYSDGSRIAGHYYQLPGSQVSSGTLDSNVSTGLIYNELNSDTATSVPPSGSPVLGRYIFNVNNGQPISPTTLVTSLSGGGDTGTSITVDPNTAVVDSATLPGANTATAGGTVTYGVYSNSTCTSAAVSAGTVTVTNGVIPDSNPIALAGLGTYYWNAAYSGDALNEPSTNSCSEVETVALPPATVTTSVDDAALNATWNSGEVTGSSAYDTASVTGTSGTPTGTVTYRWFANQTCAGGATTTDTVTIASGSVPNSNATPALSPLSYSYEVHYSGDTHYLASQGACESFTVHQATADAGTVVKDSALSSPWNGTEATGAAAYDTATLSGVAGFTPTGIVAYTFFTNGTCTGSPSWTQNMTVSGLGTVPPSARTAALAAGSYAFKAAYAGDSNYVPSSALCEPFSVVSTTSGVGTVVDNTATNRAWNGSETVGAAAYDTATVTTVGGFTPAGTLTYNLFAGGTCSGSPLTSSTTTLSGGLVPNSTSTGGLAAGSYSYSGSYSGDSNYLPATGSCEPFAVAKSVPTVGTVVHDGGTGAPWAGTEQAPASAFDTAAVSGVGGFTPTGMVTYDFFASANCTTSGLAGSTVDLSGGSVPQSGTIGRLTSGQYGVLATYSGDANYQTASAFCEPFTVFAAPAITSADNATFTTNIAGSFTVRTTGLPSGASMHLDDGGTTLPAGVAFVDNGDGTATLSGTPAAPTSGTYSFLITASNGIGTDATQAFTLTVDRPPAITSSNATAFKAGTAGAFTVVSNGFPGIGAMTLSDGGATLPAGVTFVDNGDETATLSGSPAVGSGGIYRFTITAHNGAAPDATQSFTLTIDESPTITSADDATFILGRASSFTVTMTGFPAGATASFSDGAANLPTGVSFVDTGTGTATLAGTPADGTLGAYPFTISVTNGFAPDGTQAFVLTVTAAGTATVLTSPTNPSAVGESVTLVAAVSVVAPSIGSPTGTVEFDDGGAPLTGCANQLLSTGIATCVLSFATAATHALTATYGGDANFATSTSAPVAQIVDTAATATVTTSSANPAVVGQSVTFTATVARTAPSTGAAAGSVVFTDNGSTITGCGAVNVTAGLAICTVTYVSTGTHSIVAVYGGDADDQASTAPALTEHVQSDPTSTTVTSGPNPSAVGGMVTITVTVKAAAPGSGNPTGTVTILIDGKATVTEVLDSTVDSRAIYATNKLTVGTHTITATYNGDVNYDGSSSGALDAQTVVALISVPETGGGSNRWTALVALSLILNGVVLLAWTRRRRRR